MSTLFLIPVPIADDALNTLSPSVVEVVGRLDTFIVERAKTARYWVKAIGAARPLPEMVFVEIGENGASDEAAKTLNDAFKNGRDVGLMSEAGCPGVADPGALIVALAHRIGMRVVPLSGPSSILLGLMASGLSGQKFAFHGYLSPKRPELASTLRRLETVAKQQQQTQIFIETPYRAQMVLEVAAESLQADTRFVVAQDITGIHERIISQTIRDWKKQPLPALAKAPAIFLLG
ncbi:MAG: SAM-dependent methyltransferase [Saprospiraceae bacterium]|nr:SAM-dependent methyltransferase [Saprospiraceae bacterium]